MAETIEGGKGIRERNQASLASYEKKLERAKKRVRLASARVIVATRSMQRAIEDETYYRRKQREILDCIEKGEPFRKPTARKKIPTGGRRFDL